MNSLSKAVFRPGEVALSSIKVVLDPPHVFPELAYLAPPPEEHEEVLAVEEYLGPTADDLRREAEDFKTQWETEKEQMIQDARDQAEKILQNARDDAAGEMERENISASIKKREAEAEAEKIVAEGQRKAQEIEAASKEAFEAARKKAAEQGYTAGRAEGYAEGKAEIERLIDRVRVVLERAQDKRGEILAETEQQVIDLVLLLTRKVVKVISENHREVVIANVIQALRKIKGRGNIIVRVNLADLELATEHTKEFIEMAEGTASVQIAEDSSVDQGGCIVETDFGEVDARISSQLAELESKILEISPIKNKTKPATENISRNDKNDDEA
ncbi:flagellar assembly protein FliH [Spirochaetia bacterium]|nr:flagellar assembly protein FliH [Spirochaetia bacterium]